MPYWQGWVEPTDWTPYYLVVEYNPQKAGAEIVQRIEVPSGLFAHYTNGNFFLVTGRGVNTFDLSYDIHIKDFIGWDTAKLFPVSNEDEFCYIDQCFGIISIDNHIIIEAGLYAGKYYNQDHTGVTDVKGFNRILEQQNDTFVVKEDFAGLSEYNRINNIYFNQSTNDLYTAKSETYNDSQGVFRFREKIYKYHYNKDADTFESTNISCTLTEGYNYPVDVFMTDSNIIMYHYYRSPLTQIDNDIYIYPFFNTEKFKRVNLIFLNLTEKIISAFSDDQNNIWIYYEKYDSDVREYKYELLKLRLLDEEATDNEYRKKD